MKKLTISQIVRIASGEMMANAIDWGNKRNPLKKIKGYCSWFGKGFDIENPECQELSRRMEDLD